MILELFLDGSSLLRRLARQGLGEALSAPEGSTVIEGLHDWSARYGRAVRGRSDAALLEIGREMLGWLDQGQALDGWMAADPRELIVRTGLRDDPALSGALLAAPWELLADRTGFLAQDMRLFTVARQAHGASEPRNPDYKDISLLFMAAAPREQTPLDHEREEAVILEATRPKLGQPAPVHLQVEESGTLEFLAETARLQGPFEALHISCHGNIQPQEGGPPQPVLFLETETGAPHAVTVDGLKTGLDAMPPLLFLSACRTAERGAGQGLPLPEGYRDSGAHDASGSTEEAEPDLADPFVRQISAFTANVVGWDGSVYDSEAMSFAATFYGQLSRGDTVPKAATKARRELLRERTPENPVHGAHWHLARVYLGPGGGGPICDPRATTGRPARPDAEQAFLGGDRRVPVAGRETFVGRRREIQRILSAYRAGTKGVVIHGMGNLGKSSLAARIADRMAGYRTAVVYGEVTARTVVEALSKVLEEIAAPLPLPEGKALRGDIEMMKDEVGTAPNNLDGVLRHLLAGPLDTHPILLVLDDFEQSLVPPSADTGEIVPTPSTQASVAALLAAVASAQTQSRLLVTSRYDFTLPGPGGGPASVLQRIALVPMEARDRRKQVRAKAQAGKLEDRLSERRYLVLEALDVAAGNPGLQDVLTGTILNGEEAAAQDAIAQIRAFRERGEAPPDGTDLGDFFTRMALDRYAAALTPAQATALGAAAIFSEGVPIPETAMVAVVDAAGVSGAEAGLVRLIALGLVDDWGEIAAWDDTPALRHLAVNPLARSLVEAVSEDDLPDLADAALPALGTAWRDGDGDFPFDPRGLETARLGLISGSPNADILDAAAKAAVIFLRDKEQKLRAALDLGRAAIARLADLDHVPNPILPGKLVNAASTLGEVDILEDLLETTLARDDLEPLHRGQFLVLHGERQHSRGALAGTLASYNEAVNLFAEINNGQLIAVTRGKIADMMEAQSKLVEARRIREQEELPIYESLGDQRSIAITRSKIADILEAQGEFIEARRIREEECIPVFETAGDRRSVAINRGRIASVLEAEGDLTEARRIREEECMPIFRDLDDRREISITRGKIADILEGEGDLDAALEMQLSRVKDAQDRMDADCIGNIRYSCAGIRLARGDHNRGKLKVIYDELAEAFAIMTQIDRVDRIGGIGALLGPVLAMSGESEKALEVLKRAREAYIKVGNTNGVVHCDELIGMISKVDNP